LRHPGQQRRAPDCRESITEITSEEFDEAFRTNVYAMFWITKAAMAHLPPGATISNTASVQAYDPG
jgi:NAD(P)-dependent dehydrogenase (short-subunit alcohol dehydrogenase family)